METKVYKYYCKCNCCGTINEFEDTFGYTDNSLFSPIGYVNPKRHFLTYMWDLAKEDSIRWCNKCQNATSHKFISAQKNIFEKADMQQHLISQNEK